MKKSFLPWAPTHTYHRGKDGNVLFYSNLDRLIYFSIYCTEARKREIVVLAITLMFTHIHRLSSAESIKTILDVEKESARKYARAFNEAAGLSGDLFQHPIGWACKKTTKQIRSTLAYIANNLVEKKLTKKAEDSRWTFIAFTKSDHPFSEIIRMEQASSKMRKAVRMVKWLAGKNRPLTYPLLRTLMQDLNPNEKNQLTDKIISLYSVIDYERAANYFGGYRNMIQAFTTTTGAEYDIPEPLEAGTDTAYVRMARMVQETGYSSVRKQFLKAGKDEIRNLIRRFQEECRASDYQIRRFLHIKK